MSRAEPSEDDRNEFPERVTAAGGGFIDVLHRLNGNEALLGVCLGSGALYTELVLGEVVYVDDLIQALQDLRSRMVKAEKA